MDKKKSICFITYKFFPEWGGLARSAGRLVNYLIEAGFDVHVVVPSFHQSDELGKDITSWHDLLNNPESGPNGAHIYRPKIFDKNEMMGVLAEIVLLLDMRFKFQLFHGYYLPFAFPCLTVAAHGNRPVIASIRGNDAVREGLSSMYFPYVQAVLNRATWVTSVSSDLLVNVDALANVKHKSSVILNGIDNSNFPRWKGFEVAQGVVGTVGELRFKKAIPLLIEAYSKLPKTQRENLILGGPFSDALEQRVVNDVITYYTLEDEVTHTGYLAREQLLEQLCYLNVFVVCSYHDGLPNTLLEAASCGIPIVATKVGGMLDILEDEKNALLVEPGNAQALSNAISRLLCNKDLCMKLSSGAIALASKMNYTQEKNAWLSLYKRLGLEVDADWVDTELLTL